MAQASSLRWRRYDAGGSDASNAPAVLRASDRVEFETLISHVFAQLVAADPDRLEHTIRSSRASPALASQVVLFSIVTLFPYWLGLGLGHD